jgi:predicted Zn-dependent peptidase
MSHIACIDLKCGAKLLVEPIENVRSAALQWLLPLGAAADPPDGDGHSAMLSELIFRGAGELSSRELSDAFDRLGVRRNSTVTTHHLSIGLTCLGRRLTEALPLVVSMIRQPTMPSDALEPVRDLCLQSLDALDDDPQHLVMLRLREQHLPPPFNRHGYGQRSVLERVDLSTLRVAWAERCRPAGTIIAAAGAVAPETLAARLDEALAGWTGETVEPTPTGSAAGGQVHLEQDTAQVHLGVAYDAPPEADPNAVLERLAIGVLSGGTSARLFTEVRQRRSLCYSVGASYRAGRDHGYVVLYAGTTPQRAQQTLEVSLEQIARLADGIEPDELERATIGLKSHLVMQGESTSARAAAIASDWFRLGRTRTLDEVIAEIDAITLDRLQEYVRQRHPGPYTVASIGPLPLEMPTAEPQASARGA